jgi:thiamine-phosphate pyrophosphorylase
MILYYITDLTQFPGSDAERRRALLAKIAEAGRTGIDFIQLRERDLSARELEQLATATMETLRLAPATRLLINSRIDVALAVGAHGVHLRADDITAAEARGIWLRAKTTKPVIAVSCHSVEEVALAEAHGADFAVLGPIFEKAAGSTVPVGVDVLRAATHRAAGAAEIMPVLALGGVTLSNAAECIAAGAMGIAGIRIFQAGDLKDMKNTVAKLHALARPAFAAGKAKHPYWPV